MIVKNNSKYIKHIGKFTLNIGPNDVKESAWGKVKDHPFVKAWIEDKELEIIEGSTNDITKLSASEAIEVVEYTFSTTKLKAWLEDEDRKTVKTAIEKQIKELEGEEDDGE